MLLIEWLITFVPPLLTSFLVFHGGSGSTKEEIRTAVENGVVKMNVDTGKLTFLENHSYSHTTTLISHFYSSRCLHVTSSLDTQFAYLVGIRVSLPSFRSFRNLRLISKLLYFQDFVQKRKDYLSSQVGNPEGPDKPNKKVSLVCPSLYFQQTVILRIPYFFSVMILSLLLC